MKRIIKFTIGIVVTVLILAGIAVAGVAIFVNPNNIKPYLTNVVSEKTGHEMEIAGKLKWSIYPKLGISAENVIVKNKPNFPDEPLLNAKKLIVSVQLIPLFSKQLKVDEIIINDVDLNLTTNRANQTNWEFKKSNHSTSHSNSENSAKNSKSFSINVSKIAINNANIKYHNMIENRTTKVSGFNLTTKDIHPNEPFKIDSDFSISETHYYFAGKVQYHPEEALLLLQDYNFNFEGAKEATLSGNAEINIKTERLEMKPLHFQMADLEAEGSLNGSKIFSNLDIKGVMETNNFNPKVLFSATGNPIRTNDSDALSSAKLSTEISIASNAIRFKNIQAKVCFQFDWPFSREIHNLFTKQDTVAMFGILRVTRKKITMFPWLLPQIRSFKHSTLCIITVAAIGEYRISFALVTTTLLLCTQL